jgi:hypothetical protein
MVGEKATKISGGRRRGFGIEYKKKERASDDKKRAGGKGRQVQEKEK